MSQHDYNIANAPGATVRADINALAEAIASQNGGASAPSVTFPSMLWADTTNSLLKIRNAANSAWITLAAIGSSFLLADTVIASAVSTDWFGTTPRIPRIDTSGVVEIGSTIDFHPDASGSEDYRLRIARATGANGVATITQSGTGALNIVTSAFQINGTEFAGLAIGQYVLYSGTALPAKCIAPYGQNISRTTYAAYFAAVSTTYGAGDGSTTFGVPDLRGRVIAGKDDMGGTSANRLTGLSGGLNGDVLGASGGLETHTLTTAQLASHLHHVVSAGRPRRGTNGNNYGTLWYGSSGDSTDGSVSSEVDTNTNGSDSPHNNVQPTFIGNVAIYVGV